VCLQEDYAKSDSQNVKTFPETTVEQPPGCNGQGVFIYIFKITFANS